MVQGTYRGALSSNSLVEGWRLRCGDIQVGDNSLLQTLFPESRFNGWCVAETHVLDPRILPNGRRDHFEQNAFYFDLINHLAPHARDIAQRCRTVPSVFVWGEDGRIAAALLSIVDGKDFDQSSFDEWFKALIAENNHLWKEPKIDIPEYVRVRTQSNVLVQLVAKIAAQKENDAARRFRDALNEVLSRMDHPGQ